MNNLLACAIKASLEAGCIMMEIYESRDFGIAMKEDQSPLTRADLASNRVITKYLETTGIPILSEEGRHMPYAVRKGADSIWIVDPLDGTKEFIKRNGEFTVNIALIKKGVPQLGVIYVPASKELYFASPEIGAMKSTIHGSFNSLNELIESAKKLPLAPQHKIYTLLASRSHLTKETENFIEQLNQEKGKVKLIPMGSSLKLCLLAEGTADCYPRFSPTMEWDTAAGHAICRYTGVEIIDLTTKAEIKYNREKLINNAFVAQRI